jgi:antirestriction protein ArdC
MASDVYQQITDQIIRMIEEGAGSWRMPWHSATAEGLRMPRNPLSGTKYRGLNVALLWSAGQASGHESQLWATYNQWRDAGAQVRKGERSALIFFWKRYEASAGDDGGAVTEDESGRKIRYVARSYNVFAAEQVDGFALAPVAPVERPEEARVASADAFFAGIGAIVRHGGNRAFYAPSSDHIQMPEFRQFEEPIGYYATLGHEHVHWTGDKRRCAREFGKRFGDQAYAFEELVAELGAAYLCADLGLANEPRPDHAAYIDSWLRVLRNDKRAIFTAGAKAQAAFDYLAERAGAARVAA